MLLTCQAGFESLLVRELTELQARVPGEQGPGWVRLDELPSQAAPASPSREVDLFGLTFAHLTLLAPVEIRGDSVNGLASRVSEYFLSSLQGERIEGAWPSLWFGPSELVGLGRRISAVEHAFGEQLRKKFSRVGKLAVPDLPRGTGVGPVRGLFVFFADFGRAFVTRTAFGHGSRRMADDPLAPSRSYLKVEEAYAVLGREPHPGETVCDLGAAPGGWSYSAAKRGARVLAIDNGPLKGGALDHPLIEHRREDAFKFAPGGVAMESGRNDPATYDWLFSDLVEEPHHVVRHIVEPWLVRRWCSHFVINLKFGRVDAIALLRELKAPDSPLVRYAPGTRIRHLFHDREEFTLVGTVTGAGGATEADARSA